MRIRHRRTSLAIALAALCALVVPAGAGAVPAGTVSPAIAVGAGPRQVAYDAANDRIYITNRVSNTLSVIDATARVQVAVIQTGTQPHGVAYSAKHNRVYVASYFGDVVEVYDVVALPAALSLRRRIVLPTSSFPHSIAVNDALDRVYVTMEGRQRTAFETCDQLPRQGVLVLNSAANDAYVTTVLAGKNPAGIAVNPATNRVWVTNYCGDNTPNGAQDIWGDSMTVIDGAANTAIATVPIPRKPDVFCMCPRSVSINPGTGKVYVTTFLGNTVEVFDDAPTPVRASRIELPDPFSNTDNPATFYLFNQGECSCSKGVSVVPATNRVYATNTYLGSISVIDGFTEQITAVVPTGGEPRGILALNTGGATPWLDRVWVPNYRSSWITVVDYTQ